MAVNYNYINDNSNHIRNAAINRAKEMQKNVVNPNNNNNNSNNYAKNNTRQSHNMPNNHNHNNVNNNQQNPYNKNTHSTNRNEHEQIAFPPDMVIKVSDEQPNQNDNFNTDDIPKSKPKPELNFGKMFNDFLKGIIPADGKFDSDKIFILALIFIMAKEGTDLKLVLALAYIML